MDIRTMEYYLAVIREGNISAAAESLHVAQSSLSRQMKEPEEELNIIKQLEEINVSELFQASGRQTHAPRSAAPAPSRDKGCC